MMVVVVMMIMVVMMDSGGWFVMVEWYLTGLRGAIPLLAGAMGHEGHVVDGGVQALLCSPLGVVVSRCTNTHTYKYINTDTYM